MGVENWKKVAFVFGIILFSLGLISCLQPRLTGGFIGIATTGISISAGILLLFPLIFTLIAGKETTTEGKKEKKIDIYNIATHVKEVLDEKGIYSPDIGISVRIRGGLESVDVVKRVEPKEERLHEKITRMLKRHPKEPSREYLLTVQHYKDDPALHVAWLDMNYSNLAKDIYEKLVEKGYKAVLT